MFNFVGRGKSTVDDIKGSPLLDSFGNLRVSNQINLYDAQFTYDLQPLLYEQITAQAGATIAHDATDRQAVLAFSSTPTGGQSIMQTFEHFKYQPGKGQKTSISFNFTEAVANCLKFVGYSTGDNGVEFQNDGVDNKFVIYSTTSNGDQEVKQSEWNLDRLDPDLGKNPSGKTLDLSKKQILVLDMQALYTGRVRIGFDIGGEIIYCHEFNHANNIVSPYIATANLPVRVGMTCTGTVTTAMEFTCCSVVSEGGTDKTIGYEFAQETATTLVAASAVRTHALSIRPRLLFNSIENRSSTIFIEINLLVTGVNPVKWELCLGDVITGTTAFNNVNATYSSTEYNTAGTTSGAPAIVIDSDYVESSGAGSNAGGQGGMQLTLRYPITLDAAGAHRSLGTMSLLVTGIGGVSACRAAIKWIEVR